jgi:hypothetical protein
MKTYRAVLNASLVLATCLWFALSGAMAAQSGVGGGNSNPGILPSNSMPHGLTYGEWSAKWWKWGLEQPVASSPLKDTTGANCAVGQSGRVWFLAGTFGDSTPVSRICRVPLGTMLFLPVANAFCSAEGTFVEMRACATKFMNNATEVRAEIDGVIVENPSSYRVLSPDFTLALPADNIFAVPAGDYSPSASDGVFLMLKPLQRGVHVIRFHALFPDSLVDVTYQLTME